MKSLFKILALPGCLAFSPFTQASDWSEGLFAEHRGVTNCGDEQALRLAQQRCAKWAEDRENAYFMYIINDVSYEGSSESGKKWNGARWCVLRLTVQCEYDVIDK